jgi:signal transduction histidine kinase
MSDNSIKVLMVEDEQQVAQFVKKKLLSPGDGRYEWKHANTLKSGLEHLADEHFDVILLDLGLPDSEGLNTLVLTFEKAGGVPIIVLTGMYDEETAIKAFEMGAAEYFYKPRADESSLRRAIRYAIERSRSQRKLKESEERLRGLSHRLVQVQEEERRRIAKELHDEIGQSLTALEIKLEMVSRSESRAEKLDESRAIVSDLMAKVRDLSLDLRPTMLDDLGLLPTLLWHFERYTSQTGIRVDFKSSGLKERLAKPEAETAAFRIVQEALTNIARHANVDEAKVRIYCDREILRCEIKDLGTGFTPDKELCSISSSGLSGMQERASLLDGNLIITSEPNAGTCITAEIPLTEPNEI